MYKDVAIIIPSRIGSTRLPRKPLAKIGDITLIEHVINRLSGLVGHNLYVATDSEEISNIAELSGAKSIMTSENCATGSDRVYEAMQKIENSENIKYIVNIQGDMPFIKISAVEAIIKELKKNEVEIVTPVVKVGRDVAASHSNVKVVANSSNHAMYFSRSPIAYGASEFLYHVGIYGFTCDALEKFVHLPHGKYEEIEKLEQLRALEAGMKIGLCMSDEVPISVDTLEDLEKARQYYADNKS